MSTKIKILDKALELFNNQGVHNVGVREIARELKISPGNMSYHFPKKEDVITALMEKMSQGNSLCFENYFRKKASIPDFIALYENLFNNQFTYRGVLLGNIELGQIIASQYDYEKVYAKRLQQLSNILNSLMEEGLIYLSTNDLPRFLSFLTLFGRSWIHESFIYRRNTPQKETIQHYLEMLKWQLSLLATEKGKLQLATIN